MMKGRKLLKVLGAILGVCVITFLLCVLQYVIHYYNNPYEEESVLEGTGYIVYDEDEYEQVSVSIEKTDGRYIFGNGDDFVQGRILVNGVSIDPNVDDEHNHFYFIDPQGTGSYDLYAGHDSRRDFFKVDVDWTKVLVCMTEVLSVETSENAQELGESAILIFPAETKEEAYEKLEEVIASCDEDEKEWLIECGWEAFIP